MSTLSAAFRASAQHPGQTLVLAWLYYGNGDKFIALSNGVLLLDGINYLPLLSEIPERNTSIDTWTHEFSVSDTTLSIINMPFEGDTRFSDLLDRSGEGNDKGYNNRRVVIKLWRKGVTSFEDCKQIFTGIFKDPPYDREILNANIQDESDLSLKVELDLVPDTDAADNNLGLPSGSAVKIQPVIGGDHSFNKGNDAKSLDTASTLSNAVACVDLGVAPNTNLRRWRVSRNKLNSVEVGSDQGVFWVKDETLGRLVRLTGVLLLSNDDNGCVIYHPDPPVCIDYVYANHGTAGGLGDGSTALLPIQNYIDKDFDTVATGGLDASSDAVLSGDKAYGLATFLPWGNQEIDDALIDEVNLHYYGKVTYAGGASDTYVKIGLGGVTIADIQVIIPSGGAYPELRLVNDVDLAIFPATKAGVSKTAGVQILCVNNFSAGMSATLQVYQIYKSIKYTMQGDYKVYAAPQGDVYGSWIDGRPNNADNGASGTLIQNRVGLLEHYLRVVVGLDGSKINTDTFDLASTVVAGFNGSYSLTEAPDTVESLFTLARDYNCYMWWDVNGLISIRAIPDTLDESDLDVVIDGNLIIGLLKYGRTSETRLYTGVEIEYAGYESDQGRVVTPLVQDADAQEKNNVSLLQTKLRYPSMGYRESVAAIDLGNTKLEDNKNIHNTAEVTLPLVYSDIDVGALVGFKNIPLTDRGEDLTAPYIIGGQTILPYFLVVQAGASDEARIIAEQIHQRG